MNARFDSCLFMTRQVHVHLLYVVIAQHIYPDKHSNMSEQSPEDHISSLYPPPPPYVKYFTNENVTKFKELKKDGQTDEQISEIKNLRFLVPPVPPAGSTYRSFGEIWNFEDKSITLQNSGIQQLYESIPKAAKPTGEEHQQQQDDAAEEEEEEEEIFTQERIEELKKMTKSLLLNFLEFIGLIAKNPKYAYDKIEQIRIILINLHHLLNSYRLHQSRESLILKYEEKIAADLATIDNIEKTCEAVEKRIKMLTLSEEMEMNLPYTSNTNDSRNGEGGSSADLDGMDVDNDIAVESTTMDDEAIEQMKKEAVKNLIDQLT